MLFTVFSIYDSAISTWLPPMYARNKGEMLRNFADAVADPQSKLAKHPSDYSLFELGTFDDDKCIFSLLKTPVRLCMALDFVKKDVPVVDKKVPLPSGEGILPVVS
ncbi:nonstructural protein [Apis mellifera associated microvirus 6]|nr:nonstructural protein [Apis mellifera associated microvirus 6]